MNRLTITLDDDLYAMARAHAIATKTSLSKAITDLLRNRHDPSATNSAPKSGKDAASYFDPVLGIQVSRGTGRTPTMEEIQRALDEEDIRHLELMEPSPQETNRSQNS